MKNYVVTVNGKKYEVSVEEIDEVRNTQIEKEIIKEKTVQVNTSESNKVLSPMPGKIVGILVSVGDVVEKNKPVVVLEAMKMENEIVSSFSGKVIDVLVDKGSQVSSGDVLVVIA